MQLPERAFLLQSGNGRPLPEMRSLDAYFSRNGVPVNWFVEKKLLRRQLALDRKAFVGGTIPVMREALRQIGFELAEPQDYPECLRQFLQRRIWESSVAQVVAHIENGGEPVFVKPKGRAKRFTGFVMESIEDMAQLEGTSRRQPVWCSDVVTWKSEWRFYVTDGLVVDRRRYTGYPDVLPDESIVQACLTALAESGQGTAGYGLDFGVLGDGRTAVVEWNDGLGLGSYGVDDDLYAELVLARWNEALQRSER